MDGCRGTGTVYDGYLVKDGNSVEAYNGRSEINQIGIQTR